MVRSKKTLIIATEKHVSDFLDYWNFGVRFKLKHSFGELPLSFFEFLLEAPLEKTA